MTEIIAAGDLAPAVAARLDDWRRNDVAERLWQRDHTVWSPEPRPELTDRLGWLDLPHTMQTYPALLDATHHRNDVTAVVVIGMGGSSLAPEVFGAALPRAPGLPRLIVADSTHPSAVIGVLDSIDPRRTHFLVASKSGTTLETMSLFEFFWDAVATAVTAPGNAFSAITDAGTTLQELAAVRQFASVFVAPADVGGRYSALTPFGLVPAASIGANVSALLEAAASMATPGTVEPALRLGALLGEAALAGRTNVTFFTSPSLTTFPAWLEQLIAESTGKDGKGIVPIAGETPAPAAAYGEDRVFVTYRLAGEEVSIDSAGLAEAGHPVAEFVLERPEDLGREMYRAEVAVAMAGAVLGINPFDQPDVQLAKELAGRAIRGELDADPDEVAARSAPDRLRMLLGSATPGGYVAVLAFLAPTRDLDEALEGFRNAMMARMPGIATTTGYGPRFLHSTGQLHKGGPDGGVFIQFVDDAGPDVGVPGAEYTFGDLIRGQSSGDYQALRSRDRNVLRINVGPNAADAIRRLADGLTD